MPLPLLKGKKAQFTDVLGGIQRGIGHFLDTIPRPAKVLIFLLFITAFSAMFGFLLNTTGSFCDTQGNLYKTGFFSLRTNIDLISDVPGKDTLNSAVIDPDDDLVKDRLGQCVEYYGEGWFYKDDNGTFINLTEDFYYQTNKNCVYCEPAKVFKENIQDTRRICLEDAHRRDTDNMSWYARQTCGRYLGFCVPPTDYYYESDVQGYICEDDTNETCVGRTPGDLWNKKLLETEAKIVITQDTISDYDYRNIAVISCEVGDTSPTLKFFGINFFNFKLWIALILLSGLVWLTINFKRKR